MRPLAKFYPISHRRKRSVVWTGMTSCLGMHDVSACVAEFLPYITVWCSVQFYCMNLRILRYLINGHRCQVVLESEICMKSYNWTDNPSKSISCRMCVLVWTWRVDRCICGIRVAGHVEIITRPFAAYIAMHTIERQTLRALHCTALIMPQMCCLVGTKLRLQTTGFWAHAHVSGTASAF